MSRGRCGACCSRPRASSASSSSSTRPTTHTGTARWQAHYVFSQTDRPVFNDVHATFRFEDGLIADHRDDFSFYTWSKQALGPPGLLLGWTPIIRGAVQKKAAARLEEYKAG